MSRAKRIKEPKSSSRHMRGSTGCTRPRQDAPGSTKSGDLDYGLIRGHPHHIIVCRDCSPRNPPGRFLYRRTSALSFIECLKLVSLPFKRVSGRVFFSRVHVTPNLGLVESIWLYKYVMTQLYIYLHD